jgi:hypothetical protein
MRWLTWRQDRWGGAVAIVILVAIAGGMLAETAARVNLVEEINRQCGANAPSCSALANNYSNSFGQLDLLMFFVCAGLPAAVGVFVGAPLIAREFEAGTNLLVWTQSITRRRWFAMKVSLVTLAAVVVAALLAPAVLIWNPSTFSIITIFTRWNLFDIFPPVLVSYTLFALMLGVAFCAAIKRTVPAMAVTLVAFATARIGVEFFARPRYMQPLSMNFTDRVSGDPWVFSQRTTDLAGRSVSQPQVDSAFQACSGPVPPDFSFASCLSSHGIRIVQDFQPSERFWLFQGFESAIFLTLAGLLLVASYRLCMKSS